MKIYKVFIECEALGHPATNESASLGVKPCEPGKDTFFHSYKEACVSLDYANKNGKYGFIDEWDISENTITEKQITEWQGTKWENTFDRKDLTDYAKQEVLKQLDMKL